MIYLDRRRCYSVFWILLLIISVFGVKIKSLGNFEICGSQLIVKPL